MVSVLSLLWADSCDVIEFVSFRKENGATAFREQVVFSEIPCRLSYKNMPPAEKGELSQRIKLFLPVELDIKPGSKIVVRRMGEPCEYRSSGKAAKYSEHQEIELVLLSERS